MAIAAAGLAVGFAKAGTAHPQAASSPRAANAVTHITVAASEFKFVFSKRSIPAAGTVIFTVVNKGKISHNFKIGGKSTPNLLPGKSAKLTVKFTKKGHYAYLVHDPGPRGSRHEGRLRGGHGGGRAASVVDAVDHDDAAPPTTTSTVPVGTAQTTVTVNMVEYAFQLSQTTIPSGQITFVIKNKGNEVHNFTINGTKAGAQLAPGASETWTVALPPGRTYYTCDVPFHAERGMTGLLTITP